MILTAELTNLLLKVVLGSSLAGLLAAYVFARKVLAADRGDETMEAVSDAVRQGANTYLGRQFTSIIFLVVILAGFLYLGAPNAYLGLGRVGAFLTGAVFSGLVGTVGMNIATRANSRVAQAAKEGYKKALELAFASGATTGMLTVGLGLLGATVIYLIYREQAAQVLIGFGLGGSLLALFMRVGGGIYTKAADIGADLVGKLEEGIPEDDPRNAAVIADQVGDNVGDLAGMAADLFESYEVTLVAALILGGASFGIAGVIYPLLVRALGILTSLLGIFSVRSNGRGGMETILRAFAISAAASILGFWVLARFVVGDMRFFAATTVGIILAVIILWLTDYFTGKHQPVKDVAEKTQAGAGPTILQGLSLGFESSSWALLAIGVTILAAFAIFGNPLTAAYGVALAGMGMLATTGLVVSMESFGPVVDNAQGIAEMAKLKGGVLATLNKLDSMGNTMKATTKGFAIASAVVAATALFESYLADAGLVRINLVNPAVFVGLLIGGAIPFMFATLAIRAVARGAFAVVKEVRRQFKQIPGLLAGKSKPDYARVVDLTTKAALSDLVTPAIVAILVPILIGFLLKGEALGAFLAGTILVGQLLAVFMANAGGAWDNAKKMIEAGAFGGKGSGAYEAGVVGDIVGDPLKDTAGPAMNPLIKVMSLIAILIAPVVMKTSRLGPIAWLGIAGATLVLGGSLIRAYGRKG